MVETLLRKNREEACTLHVNMMVYGNVTRSLRVNSRWHCLLCVLLFNMTGLGQNQNLCMERTSGRHANLGNLFLKKSVEMRMLSAQRVNSCVAVNLVSSQRPLILMSVVSVRHVIIEVSLS